MSAAFWPKIMEEKTQQKTKKMRPQMRPDSTDDTRVASSFPPHSAMSRWLTIFEKERVTSAAESIIIMGWAYWRSASGALPSRPQLTPAPPIAPPPIGCSARPRPRTVGR